MVDNSNLMAGQIFFDISKSQNWYVLTHSKGVLTKKGAKLTKFWVWGARLKVSAGHIWPAGRMLCMPDLNRGKESSHDSKKSFVFLKD